MSKKHINKNYINNKGVTLIAMVVTIIVLIILAGVSLNLILGKNGIMTRAEEQKETQAIADITERLELKKADVSFESEKGNVPLDAYIEEVTTSDRMLHEITDVERIDTGNAYITVEDKYVYLLEQEENGNLKITFEGQASKLKPRIQDLEIKTSTNKIEVEVTAVRADKYVFYIKEKDGAEYTKKEENTSGKYIFKDLGQNKEYSIKVEAVNDNGKDEREINRTTGEMTNLTSAEVKYIKSNTNWTNENVITTIEIDTEKDITGYDLQYTKFIGEVTSEKLQNATWTNYSDSGIVSEENETIYTRLYDGYNATSYTSTTIANIDKENPTISTALASLGVTTKGFTLNVGVTDTESGLGKIVWYYKLSTETSYKNVERVYTELKGNTAGTTTEALKTEIFDNLINGTYNTYIEVYDVAGNSIESAKVEVKLGDILAASGATASPTTWTNGKVTVTLPTQSGYTTQYQLGGVSGSWTNYSSAFTVSSNTTVYYRYNDGTNAGTYASKSISNIDKTVPTISTALNSTNVTTKGFTLNVGVTDPESGLGKIVWYYKLSSATNYTSVEEVYTAMNGNSVGTTSAVSKSKAITNLTAGTYNAYAIAYDVAGNSKQSSTINITLTAVATASGASASPTYWTNGNVTVTLPTQSGYTTQYQLGGVSGSWTNYSSAFAVSSNTTVYYRYNDGTNAGTYASKSISNIDKTVPTISTALASSSVTTKGFTLSMGVTDANSGLSKITWYYKKSTASSYTSATDTYTTMNGSTAGTKTAVSKSKAITNLAAGTYNAYAIAYDVAGNSKQSSTINITLGTVATASGASISPSGWTNGNVTVTLPKTTGYTTQYQLGGVSGSWTNYSSAFTVSSNTTVYYRYNDGTNVGSYASKTISNIDKLTPGATTVSYAGGSNTCTWKSNYNLSFTSTDAPATTTSGSSGIWYHEVDSNGDGSADLTPFANFVPENGYSSCNTRFRAVDYAGNKGPWTEVHHVHMDTQIPTHTSWWWGEVTKDVARLYIQTTDNVGISKVQCPTSTETGGYNNWYWFEAVWDASANAYRCDITPSTFGHYGQTYQTHLYIYDHAGNGGYYNQTSVAIPVGEKIIYSATYGLNSNGWQMSLTSENVKNTTYISSVDSLAFKTDSGTSPDYKKNGTATILTLTNQASKEYKYAEVVVGINHSCSYGDVDIKVNGIQQVLKNVYSGAATESKVITLTLSSSTSITASMNLVNKSSYTGAMTYGTVYIQSVKLYN